MYRFNDIIHKMNARNEHDSLIIISKRKNAVIVANTALLSWLRGRDLNPRPLGYEPNELPDCSTPRYCKLLLTIKAAKNMIPQQNHCVKKNIIRHSADMIYRYTGCPPSMTAASASGKTASIKSVIIFISRLSASTPVKMVIYSGS